MKKDELLDQLREEGTEATLVKTLSSLSPKQSARFLAKIVDFLEGNRCLKRGHILEAILRAIEEEQFIIAPNNGEPGKTVLDLKREEDNLTF
jgi:hypothetical protein